MKAPLPCAAMGWEYQCCNSIWKFAGIGARLDYLKKIGNKVLYINSIYESDDDDNYAVVDHKKVDTLFGTMGDFDQLRKASKKKESMFHQTDLRYPNHLLENVSSQNLKFSNIYMHVFIVSFFNGIQRTNLIWTHTIFIKLHRYIVYNFIHEVMAL